MTDLEKAARQVLAALKGADRVPPRLYWVSQAIAALESALKQQAEPVQAEPVVEDLERVGHNIDGAKWLHQWANRNEGETSNQWKKGYDAARDLVRIMLDAPQQAEPVELERERAVELTLAYQEGYEHGTRNSQQPQQAEPVVAVQSPMQGLLRDALEYLRDLPWESETSTQKRGETLQGHRDRMSSVIERNNARRALIEAIEQQQAEPVVAKQAEPVALQAEPEPPFFAWRGCRVCGLGAEGRVVGYVCPRGDCPTQVRSGTHDRA